MTLQRPSLRWNHPAQRPAGAAPAGFKRRERNARRWRLLVSRWIYEVTGPRYALHCFVTHVEARSAPVRFQVGTNSTDRSGAAWTSSTRRRKFLGLAFPLGAPPMPWSKPRRFKGVALRIFAIHPRPDSASCFSLVDHRGADRALQARR